MELGISLLTQVYCTPTICPISCDCLDLDFFVLCCPSFSIGWQSAFLHNGKLLAQLVSVYHVDEDKKKGFEAGFVLKWSQMMSGNLSRKVLKVEETENMETI